VLWIFSWFVEIILLYDWTVQWYCFEGFWSKMFNLVLVLSFKKMHKKFERSFFSFSEGSRIAFRQWVSDDYRNSSLCSFSWGSSIAFLQKYHSSVFLIYIIIFSSLRYIFWGDWVVQVVLLSFKIINVSFSITYRSNLEKVNSNMRLWSSK